MQQESDARPLVTFAVFAYNQEAYIREAMAGALSQTYEPLEIVFSDDHSPDRTYEIMQEVVAAYDGPHRVRLRRSQRNRGLLAHINEAAREFSGEIVVMAAGDDISLPQRTERLVETFSCQPDVHAVCSGMTKRKADVDLHPDRNEEAWEVSLYEIAATGGGIDFGASYAYRKECFFWPGEMPLALYSEDRILPLRAAILGRLLVIRDRLVFYRVPASQGRLTLKEKGIGPLFLRAHVDTVTDHLDTARREKRIGAVEQFFCKTSIRLAFLINKLRCDGRVCARLTWVIRGAAKVLLIYSIRPRRRRIQLS